VKFLHGFFLIEIVITNKFFVSIHFVLTDSNLVLFLASTVCVNKPLLGDIVRQSASIRLPKTSYEIQTSWSLIWEPYWSGCSLFLDLTSSLHTIRVLKMFKI